MVRPAAPIFPCKVAVPAVLVIETCPVVEKPAMLWVVMVFAITTGELPAVKVPPEFIKSPPNVNWKFAVAIDAPLLMLSGTELLNTLSAVKVIVPVFAIITPPVAANGVIHSFPADLETAVLY